MTTRMQRHRPAVITAALGAVAIVAAAITQLVPATVAVVPSDFIIIPRSMLMTLPTSGPAWTNLLSYAAKSASSPDVSDQDDPDNVVVLAKALVAARTDDAGRRSEVVAALVKVQGTEAGTRALALGRELGAYVLAADLIGYRDSAFVSWVSRMRTFATSGGPASLIKCHEQRPNNWGTHCGASRAIADAYLGDVADFTKAWYVYQGWLGERAAYAAFVYGDLSWQANAGAPVGINPAGATKSGTSIDGVLPDDMRRGGSFPTIGADGVSYTWEAMQGALLQAEVFRRAGLDPYALSDRALARAAAFMYGRGHPVAGDDAWQASLLNARNGTAYPAAAAPQPGKNVGFTDWLTLGSEPGATPTPTPSASPSASPSPSSSPSPSPSPTPTPTPSLSLEQRIIDLEERVTLLEELLP